MDGRTDRRADRRRGSGELRAARQVQEGLLALLRPPSARLEQQVAERVRPHLSQVARTHAGRPAPEVLPVLVQVVRDAGAEPDLRALAEHAERISAGEDPYA